MSISSLIQELNLRLDHLESAAEWLTRATIQEDMTVSQTGVLISTLTEDIRSRVETLVESSAKSEEPREQQDLH